MKKISLISRMSLVLSFLLVLSSQPIFSQSFFGQPYQHVHDERCAALLMEEMQEEQLGVYGTREYFESWMNDKIKEVQSKPSSNFKTLQGIKTIPVVVHVIHNGEALGVGPNIPLSQIQAQIRILTEDFRRLNPDADQTPAEFLDVAADTQIEFVFAKQDPRGLPTTGINRVQGPKTSYSNNDAELISGIAMWDPNEYLNIWVLPLTTPVIGYASYPIAELPGLNFPNNANTDGVTIDYRYFGEGGNATSGTQGRTATHEVGHFLGLRHIWGDGNCNADDFVEDTPRQETSNFLCRIDNPRFSCDSRDMTENFMDYTPDACMNIFTRGQTERMDVVLEFSPRRASLVNNRATQEPQLLNNDLAFERIIEPQDFICSTDITPSFEVFNAGSNLITSARIEIRNNGVLLETRTFPLNLTTGQTATVAFNNINFSTASNNFEANIITVNGAQDPNTINNTITSTPTLKASINLPYTYQASDINTLWNITNPDDDFTWNQQTITLSGNQENVIMMRNYEYETEGELDFFISPRFNLSQYPNAQLTFNVSYAPYNINGFTDNLYVAISTDCGNSFDIINAPYNKDRDFLQTAEPTLDEFIPDSAGQFRREIVNLNQYQDLGEIQIAFVSRNGFANNIFIKDIEILTEESYRYALEIDELINPSPISTGEHQDEIVAITNTGNLPISGFVMNKQINNNSNQRFLARGVSLAPGNTTNINISKSNLRVGLNNLNYTVTNPNFDQNNQGSSNLNRYVIMDTDTIPSPWRQNFNNTNTLSPWLTVNPENNRESWDLVSLQTGDFNNAARLENQQGQNSYWIGSPVFDLSGSQQASILFDRAAGQLSTGTTLKVLASGDGGVTYKEVYRKSGAELTTVSGGAINPNNPSDFVRDYANLSEVAGPGNTKGRVAFVLEGGNIANSPIYLNNIELFLSANPDPVNPGLGSTVVYPNPARDVFNIVFNFEDFEDVNIQIYSPTGALVHDLDYPNTLNQTYSFSTQLFSKGLFIVKISSNSLTETKKLFIH